MEFHVRCLEFTQSINNATIANRGKNQQEWVRTPSYASKGCNAPNDHDFGQAALLWGTEHFYNKRIKILDLEDMSAGWAKLTKGFHDRGLTAWPANLTLDGVRGSRGFCHGSAACMTYTSNLSFQPNAALSRRVCELFKADLCCLGARAPPDCQQLSCEEFRLDKGYVPDRSAHLIN
jgi:hypothetical protein